MRWFWKTLTIAFMGGLLLSTTPALAQLRPRVVIVRPVPVYRPFFAYPYPYWYYPYAYPYGYAPGYMNENIGYVKIETNRKDASVYVDGGYADRVEKTKKFAIRPGTHEIELRDSDGRTIFEERVAVLVGKTTKLHVG
jgi:hypothetical protein